MKLWKQRMSIGERSEEKGIQNSLKIEMNFIVKINRNILLIFLLSIFQIQIVSTQNTDTVFFENILTPLNNQQPTISIDTIKDDPLNFHAILLSESITITFNGTIFNGLTVNELDAFIKTHDIANVSPKVYLEASKDQPVKKVVEVMDVFTNNNINEIQIKVR